MMHVEQKPVVVGVDDTATSEAALAWAETDARPRRAPLRIVYAYGSRVQSVRTVARVPMTLEGAWQGEREYATQRVRELIAHIRAANPTLTMTAEAVSGDAIAVLVRESAEASLIVLGSRRLHALGSFLFGSVGQGVTSSSSCPVVVVRGARSGGSTIARVVVGIGFDEESQAVFEIAIDEASRRHVALKAVTCCRPNRMSPVNLVEKLVAGGRFAVEEWLALSLSAGRQKYPHVEVIENVVDQRPIPGLLGAVTEQDLLVMGRHPHHLPSGSLLGSTSRRLLHRAVCPVAVIPAGTGRRPTDSGKEHSS